MTSMIENIVLQSIEIHDLRFPTHLESHGSDAMHTDPIYSLAYVILRTNTEECGYGFAFTIGRGNEVVIKCVEALEFLIKNKKLSDIINNFGTFWYDVVNESQLRWLGPSKGVIHMATAAIMNSIWDLWSRLEKKPLWKLVVDMSPEQIISLLDFSYIEDFLSKADALKILKKNESRKDELERLLIKNGYPAYVTSAGWIGYDDDTVVEKCHTEIKHGFKNFKMKVGIDLQSDMSRMKLIRSTIGDERLLMIDANQKWSVNESINWVKSLATFKPFWIEEPTSCDDILGHGIIAKELKLCNIKVATGEHCHNKVMFKQFLQHKAMDICQIDSCRLAGPNEVILVLLMAAHASIPVCPHAGGVGLCELVQHYSYIDYILINGSTDNRMIEFADHLHEHFDVPVVLKNGNYQVPMEPGFNSKVFFKTIENYSFPSGKEWQKILQEETI